MVPFFLIFLSLCGAEVPSFSVSKLSVSPLHLTKTVTSIVPLREGEPYDKELKEISIRLLRATEQFESVSISEDLASKSVFINVKQKQYIDKIEWSESFIPQQALLKSACVSPTQSSDLTSVEALKIKDCLVKKLQGFGYLDVQLSLDVVATQLKVNVKLGPLYIIHSIQFDGSEKISHEVLSEGLENRRGKGFHPYDLQADTRKIMRTYLEGGFYFAQVFQPQVQIDFKAHHVSLSWKISESYEMNLVFSGHKKSRERLYEMIDREQTFPSWFLDEIVDGIKGELSEEGYLSAKVTVTKHIDQRGVETIEILSKRGTRYDLIGAEWVGVFDEQEVRKLYESFSEFRSGAPYEEEKLRSLLADDFVKLLMSRGYLDARFKDVDFQVDRTTKRVKPIIYITEGSPYRVARIDFDGSPGGVERFQEFKDLKSALVVNKIFDLVRVDQLQTAFQRRLVSEGYLDAQVTRDIQKNDGAVGVRIRIVAGPRYRVSKVLIRGAVKTDYDILRQEIVLEAGDFYEDEKVRDSVSQILRLGIVRSVDIQPFEKNPQTGVVFALVDISEAARFRFEFGPGFGTTDGLRAVFRATYANIGGRARRINLYVKGSRTLEPEKERSAAEYFNPETIPIIQRRIGIEYFEPSMFNFRLDGRLNFVHSKLENDKAGLKNSFTGAVDYRFSRRYIFTSFYELAFTDPFNVRKDGRTSIDAATSKRFTSVGEIALFDFLDDSFSPTKGTRWRLEGSLYDKFLGGEVQMWQALQKVEFFTPIYTFRKGRAIGFALSLNAGFTDVFGETEQVPVEKRLIVGGESSVRGFGEGRIRPRLRNGQLQDGGNSFFSFMTEVNVPLVSTVDFLAFFDAGNAFLSNKDFRPWSLRYGAGPGMRLNTAVGPLKFGYGFNLFRRAGEEFGTFYLGVGAI